MDKIVSIICEGITVEGEIVRRSSSDIVVKIIKPYYGLTNGLHIPYFGRPYHDFLNNYGDARAKDLLKKLYLICSTISQKKDKLKTILLEYNHAKNDLKFKIGPLKSSLINLKNEFKDENIDQKQYQAKLKNTRRAISELEHNIRELFDTFFADHFEESIPLITRKDIINFIDKL